MPRNVRNFWLDADIDGKATRLSGGPVNKEGGMTATLKIRDDGTVHKALTINAFAYPDGRLLVNVFDGDGELVHKIESAR